MSTGNILSGGAAQTIESIASADPAAGSNVSMVVPAGEQWLLESLHVSLVTDATVANRRMVLTVDNGVNIVAKVSAGFVQAASLTHDYTFAQGVLDYSAIRDNHGLISLPSGLLVPSGYRVRTAVVNLQAGDNLGVAYLLAQVRR
ncbi:MAG TPA: hypothetical protein VFK94_02215 [Patescibacteria group bacterium]|nr:hypothetical protein [Patescibacteria group bacterium]